MHLPLCTCFFQPLRPPPTSTVFPYTTLSRSLCMTWGDSAARSAGRSSRVMDCSAVPATTETPLEADRKSTRLNSSHVKISYAVFCLKKKKTKLMTLLPPLPQNDDVTATDFLF